MRTRIHKTLPQPSAGETTPMSTYDWSRLGLHTFRVSAGTVIDFPLPVGAGSHVWVASLWPDARLRTGWGGWAWQPESVQGRGWLLPDRLMCGDVVEFAVDQADPNESAATLRWWGVFDAYNEGWRMTIQGPYSSPGDAYDAAERLLALERYQPPKTATAKRAHPGLGRVACTRSGRHHLS